MATFVLPNIVTGQSITVQGNNLAQAQQNAANATGVSLGAQQGGGTFGGEGGQGTVESGGSSKVSGSGSQTVNQPGQQTQNPGAGLDALLQAAQRGDKETFEKTLNEQIREWNDKYGLDLKQFDENVRQYNQNFGITQAGVTGTYQGAPTQAAQLQQANLTGYYSPYAPGSYVRDPANGAIFAVGPNGQMSWVGDPSQIQPGATSVSVPGLTAAVGGLGGQGMLTQAAQQQQYAQQMGMIAQASALQANPFRQQQAIGQMGNLLGGNGVAGFSAPNTVAGVGVAGGNTQGGLGYLRQMIDDIRDPTANAASMNQVLAGIPTPNKVNSNEFLRAAPSTQSMVLQGMQEKYGIDPNDALAQIKNTLPQFQAPTTIGSVKR